jgi:LemA protein
MPVLIIILVIVLALGLWLVMLFNGLVKGKNRVNEAWSDIDVQMKRRYDLIPNLVNTVKGYAKHEQQTLEKVIAARNKAMEVKVDAGASMEDFQKVQNQLSSALKSIFALSESYPDLKANQNFLELQRELADTENKIEASRRFYNGNVRDFNIAVEQFPNNMFAGMFGFGKRDLFETETAAERKAVEVKF